MGKRPTEPPVEDLLAANNDDDDVEPGEVGSSPFGQTLVEKGYATSEAVDLAIQLQSQLAARGVFMRLGELLVARGVISEEIVTEVLALQGTTILVCEQCMAQYNVLIYQRALSYRCSRCQTTLKLPEQLTGVSVEDTLVHSDLELDAVNFGSGREFGSYVILGQISRGGMGIVYKARQRDLDRVVALKVITQGGDTTTSDVEAFTREARAVARLRHPNIVAIHEIGRLGSVDFYTMDYIEGLPLERAVTAEGLAEREIVEVFVKLCDAVEYSHSQGVLHRDLKPQNVLLDQSHSPILIDFGIAEEVGQATSTDRHIIGSPAYLPPEYVSGQGVYDIRGEIYALGATMYTIFAGRPPHSGIDTVQMLRRASVDPVVPLLKLRRTVNPGLARIIMTAISRDPERRYARVRDVALDLRRWLEGDEVAGSRSRLERAWGRIRGRVAATLGLALAFFLISSSIGYSLAVSQRNSAQAIADQLKRERIALRAQVTKLRLEKAVLLLVSGQAATAEALLTRLLPLAPRDQGTIYDMRARARDALQDVEGAAADRNAAAKLGFVKKD
jgi:hypothetical protein